MMTLNQQSPENLIDILHKVHCDNSRQQYFAQKIGSIGFSPGKTSTMPLTPFVYEFFLFNSLYQVDWQYSLENRKLTFHPSDENGYSESKQQRKFLTFVKNYAKGDPPILYRAFDPLRYLPPLDGDWTKVTSDARISDEDGINFFRRIKGIVDAIERCVNPSDMPTSKALFSDIGECVHYIYMVRNNIFHGAKTLGNIWDFNQRRRLEVYNLFIICITSLFFLSVKKTSVASDFVPCPIKLESPSFKAIKEWEKALLRGFIKISDARLISQLSKLFPNAETIPSEKSSLFYPSAGRDLLTPILLGLPYCRNFYFYEIAQKDSKVPLQPNTLENLLNIQPHHLKWQKRGENLCLDFEYQNINRRINWVHADNRTFLDSDAELTFYFHRGDSLGEGGSGQCWDSDYLPKLIKMIPEGKMCLFLTDGEPNGFDDSCAKSCETLSIPFLERNRTYYFGALK